MHSQDRKAPLSAHQISVILPCFNRSGSLIRAIDSILVQTLPVFEIIIVDDGSTDNTTEILGKVRDPRLKTVSLNQNYGVSYARNRGIERAKGEWLAFLDSDDEWLENKLKQQIEKLAENPELKVIHGEEIWIRNGVRVNPMKKHKKQGGKIFRNCIPLCVMSPSTILIHRSVFESVGYFDESYPVCEDYDLWLRVCEKFEVGFVESPILKKYGGHNDQLSTKFKAMDYWRVKSLSKFLDSSSITKEDQKLIQSTILNKAGILLKGYKKHNNLQHFSEIEKIKDQVIKSQENNYPNQALVR